MKVCRRQEVPAGELALAVGSSSFDGRYIHIRVLAEQPKAQHLNAHRRNLFEQQWRTWELFVIVFFHLSWSWLRKCYTELWGWTPENSRKSSGTPRALLLYKIENWWGVDKSMGCEKHSILFRRRIVST